MGGKYIIKIQTSNNFTNIYLLIKFNTIREKNKLKKLFNFEEDYPKNKIFILYD